MSPLQKLTRLIDGLLAALLAGIFLLVTLLVILRYAFDSTIIGGHEAILVAFIYTTAIGASTALWRDEHIRIDYFVERLSGPARRRLAMLRWSLLIALHIVIIGASVVWIARTGHFLMPTLGLPQWVAQISVPIGATLSVIYGIHRTRG